jgi:hypothetical protein
MEHRLSSRILAGGEQTDKKKGQVKNMVKGIANKSSPPMCLPLGN